MARAPAEPEKPKKPPNHERWVISYADLLTLLLATFVVLYASSTRNKQKMAESAESFIKAFHGTPTVVESTAAPEHALMSHQPSPIARPVEHPAPREAHATPQNSQKLAAEALALAIVKQLLETMLAPQIAAKQVSVQSQLQSLTLTITLNDQVLFVSGQATLLPAAQALLVKVAGGLMKLPDPFTITVQGYTDDQPIANAQFPSNWSLSAERAVSVVQLFDSTGVDGARMTAQGFGPYQPVASNATDAGRAQNRRVDIVIHAPDPNNGQ